MDALKAERAKLAIALANCDRDALPGSRAWLAETKALRALTAFDAAHPEVIAAIKAEHSERVLGGKDVLGL